MAYFSNVAESLDYQEKFCVHCVHFDGCSVWLLHLLHNYEEARNKESFLNDLIPLSADGLSNEKCTLFYPASMEKVSNLK